MQKVLLCVFLCVFIAHLSRTRGMTLMNPEKKGWTLNSAGYLLGPYAHRSLNVRHRAAIGKRNTWKNIFNFDNPLNDDDEPILGHLAYLRIKDGKADNFFKELGIAEKSKDLSTSGHVEP